MGTSKKTILQRRYTYGQRHMKLCSISLIIREMQITTIKYQKKYQTGQVRMAKIKMCTNNKGWQSVEKKEPSYTVDRNVNWCSHYEKQHGVPEKN